MPNQVMRFAKIVTQVSMAIEPMIHVLYLTPQLNIGGTEHHVLKICRSMPKHLVKLFVYCANPRDKDSLITRKLRNSNVEVIFHPLGVRGLISLVRLHSFIRQEKIDIVHSFFYGNLFWDSLIYLLSPAKIFITERRNLQHWRKSNKLGPWEKFRNRISTNIVANSTEVKRTAISRENLSEDRISVIHNGVDAVSPIDNNKRLSAREKLGFNREDFILVNVANLKIVKRQEDLLTAIDNLCSQVPEISWRLVLVGRSDQNYDEKLRSRARELGLTSRVFFAGEKLDPSEFLYAADVFVLSSDSEGFSNALLESFAYGLAAVATRVGGNVDLINDGVNGLLYTPRDTQDLTYHLHHIALDPELRSKLGRAALNTAQLFSIDKTVEKYIELYKQTLDQFNTRT